MFSVDHGFVAFPLMLCCGECVDVNVELGIWWKIVILIGVILMALDPVYFERSAEFAI